ncbi:MAG TPA: hypothetical protein VGI99_14320 [Gemmataceae bacterium]
MENVAARQLADVRRVQAFDVTGAAAIFDSIPHFRGPTPEIVHMTRDRLGDGYPIRLDPGDSGTRGLIAVVA